MIPGLAQTRVLARTRIRRERLLPMRGEVVAAIGKHVDALEVVAFSESGNVRPIPLARYLRVPENALPKYLLKRVGERVQARETLAAKPEFLGLFQRIYRAPGVGRVAALQGSWLAFDLEERIELSALYRGTVLNVLPRLGIVIEATGALIQGAWGGGGEGIGILKKMTHAPADILTEEQIDVSARGTILLAGAGATEKALERAAQERATGLVVGGLTPRLKAVVAKLRLPTMLTEGWGARAMAQPIFDLLVTHAGEETALNPATRAHGGATRPEVFIPLLQTTGAAGVLPPPPLSAEAGARVRVTAGAQIGAIGKIVAISKAPQLLDSGIHAWGAEIECNSERVFVPWENLELID